MIQQLRYSIAVFISMVITMGIWAHQVQADDFTRNYRNTSINWTKEIIMSASTADIRITKEGQPLNIDTGVPTSLNRARQAAYLHARNHAIEEMAMSIQHIIVDPDTTMRELLQRETFTQAGLAELIQKHTSSRVYPSGFTTAHCLAKLEYSLIRFSRESEHTLAKELLHASRYIVAAEELTPVTLVGDQLREVFHSLGHAVIADNLIESACLLDCFDHRDFLIFESLIIFIL
mgnify:CR=1 FL=1